MPNVFFEYHLFSFLRYKYLDFHTDGHEQIDPDRDSSLKHFSFICKILFIEYKEPF